MFVDAPCDMKVVYVYGIGAEHPWMSGVIEWCFRGHERGNQNIKPNEILTLSGPWLRSDS
jgi:hypothetical protein